MLNISELNRQIRILSTYTVDVLSPAMKYYNDVISKIETNYDVIIECLTSVNTDELAYSILVYNSDNNTYSCVYNGYTILITPDFQLLTASVNGINLVSEIVDYTIPKYLFYTSGSDNYVLTVSHVSNLIVNSDTQHEVGVTIKSTITSISPDMISTNTNISTLTIETSSILS